MSGSTDEKFLTPDQVCQRWGISRRTLSKMPLPHVRVTERVVRYRAQDVAEFEARNRFAGST